MKRLVYLVYFSFLVSLPALDCTYNGVDCYVFNDFYRVPISFLKRLNASNPREVACFLELDPSVWSSLSWRVCSHIPAQIVQDLAEKMPNFRSLVFHDDICNATTPSSSTRSARNETITHNNSISSPPPNRVLYWPCDQVQESVRSVWISCGLCAPEESWLRYFRWMYRLRIFIQSKFIDMVIVLCFISYETEMIFGLSDACEDLVRGGLQRIWKWFMYYVNFGYTIAKDFFSKSGVLAVNTIVTNTIKEQDPKAAKQLEHMAHEVEELGQEGQSLSSALDQGAASLTTLESLQMNLAKQNTPDLTKTSTSFIDKLSLGVHLLHKVIRFAIKESPTSQLKKEVQRDEQLIHDLTPSPALETAIAEL